MSTQRLMWKWEFPKTNGNYLVAQCSRLSAFTAEGKGSIPGQWSKILQALQPGQEKERKEKREREKKKRLIDKCSKKHFPKVETTQTSIDDEISKMWYIHTIEYHLAIKKNEGLIHSTTWMKLRNAVLSQISQIPKTHTAWFHLHDVSR